MADRLQSPVAPHSQKASEPTGVVLAAGVEDFSVSAHLDREGEFPILDWETAQSSKKHGGTVSGLAGLGPKSEAMLAQASITSVEQLRKLGSVRAFMRVKQAGLRPSINLLWALEGGLSGLHWQQVAKDHRTSLLLALEQLERAKR